MIKWYFHFPAFINVLWSLICPNINYSHVILLSIKRINSSYWVKKKIKLSLISWTICSVKQSICFKAQNQRSWFSNSFNHFNGQNRLTFQTLGGKITEYNCYNDKDINIQFLFNIWSGSSWSGMQQVSNLFFIATTGDNLFYT